MEKLFGLCNCLPHSPFHLFFSVSMFNSVFLMVTAVYINRIIAVLSKKIIILLSFHSHLFLSLTLSSHLQSVSSCFDYWLSYVCFSLFCSLTQIVRSLFPPMVCVFHLTCIHLSEALSWIAFGLLIWLSVMVSLHHLVISGWICVRVANIHMTVRRDLVVCLCNITLTGGETSLYLLFVPFYQSKHPCFSLFIYIVWEFIFKWVTEWRDSDAAFRQLIKTNAMQFFFFFFKGKPNMPFQWKWKLWDTNQV